MSFDADLRDRLSASNVTVHDIDAGANAAAASATRRSVVRRVGAVGAVVLVLFAGILGVANLGDEQASDLRTADPDVPTEPDVPAGPELSDDPAVVSPTIPNELSTPVPSDAAEQTAIVTLDIHNIIRINDVVTFDASADELRALLEAMDGAPSVGPDGQTLNRRIGTSTADQCPVHTILDADGQLVDDHPINRLSRCIPDEIADWSTAGHVVLVAPTQGDAWTITVLAADGETAQLTSQGAFQPMQLDVHTDAAGRTQALVLGTGEELVYVDVDLFLESADPGGAVLGLTNPTNLVSARFVDGYPQHWQQGQIDMLNDPTLTDEVTDEPLSNEPATVWVVTGVAEDDTLNARSGPGVSFDIVFEFAPNATGVVATGNEATSNDGALWVEVFSPTSGAVDDVGWVNSSFLDETTVPDARPCLFNGPQDHYIGIDWTNPDGSADSDAEVISNVETYRFGRCIRTVFEFADGWSYQDGGASRVDVLPNDIVITRDEPPRIDFGTSITGAEVAEARFAERAGVAQSTFVSMGAGRHLEGVLYGPTTTMFAAFDNTNGTLIVDIADIRLPIDADPEAFDRVGRAVGPSIDENGVVVETVSTTPDQRTWTFNGLARPFEANLGVQVRTADGEPLDVGWINGVVEGQRSDNGVMTSTWTDAWGQFTFSVILPGGVDPSEVVVVLDPSGGAADDPQTVELPLSDWVG